jgi:glycopeptide antibiotics resistance protein
LLPLAFELVQLPLYSKHVTTIEVLGGWLGGALGYLLGSNLFRLHALVQRPIAWGLAWMLAMATTFVALLFNHAGVLHDSAEIARRFSDAWQWPLVRYYSGSEYNALTNMLVKLGLFAMMGVAAFGWQKTSSNWLSRVVVVSTLVVAIVAAFAIELVQILLPPHVADISDAITYCLGYGAGYQVTRLLWGHDACVAAPQRGTRLTAARRPLVVSSE